MKRSFFIAITALLLAACNKDEQEPEAIVFSATGDITVKLDEFRAKLGGVINTTPGQTSGRREINWDGVPEQYASQKLPSDFFNTVDPGTPTSRQRGLLYSAEVDARVSSNVFADLEPTNGTEFLSFSGSKTFSTISSNLWNVEFEVAGQRQAASVKGFGAVFSDVDNMSSTTIEYFSGNRSLGVFKVPPRTTGNHSFLGVYFPKEKVTKVRIRQGTASVAAALKDVTSGGTQDLVIMDDFIYDEPLAIQ